MTKRIVALLLSIICCLGIFTACHDRKIDGEIIKGAEVKLYLAEPVYDLDPANAYYNDATTSIVNLLFETLFKINENGTVKTVKMCTACIRTGNYTKA